MVQGAVDWVKLLFTDPKAALDDLWETFKKAVGFTPIGLVGTNRKMITALI